MALGNGAISGYHIGGAPIADTFTQAPTGTGVQTYAGSFVLANKLGNQPVSGIGFTPVAVVLWGSYEDGNGGGSETQEFIGVATTGSQWCTMSAHNVLKNYTTTGWDDATCVQYLYAQNGGAVSMASMSNFTSDGFVLNVNNNNSTQQRYVNFLAIGGSSVSAKSGAFAAPAVTGNQSVTGVGFLPKLLMFASGTLTASTNRTHLTDCRRNIGWAASSTKQYAQSARVIAGATSNVHSISLTDSCLLMNTDLGVEEKASFVSNDADGFTINWLTKSATTFETFYLALGGAASYDVGSFSEPSSTGSFAATNSLGIKPQGAFFASNGQQSSSITTGARSSISAATTSTNMCFAGSWDPSGSADAAYPVCASSTAYSVFSHGSSQGARISSGKLMTNDSNGFTINWDTVVGQNNQFAFQPVGIPVIYGFWAIGAGSATARTKSLTAATSSTTTLKHAFTIKKIATASSARFIKQNKTRVIKAASTISIKLGKSLSHLGNLTNGMKVAVGNSVFIVRGASSKGLKITSASINLLAKKLAKIAATKATSPITGKIVRSKGVSAMRATSGNSSIAKRGPQKAMLLYSSALPSMNKTGLRRLTAAFSEMAAIINKGISSKRKATAASASSLGRARTKAVVSSTAAASSFKKRSMTATKAIQSPVQTSVQQPRLLYKSKAGVASSIMRIARGQSTTRKAIASSAAIIGRLSVIMRKLSATSTNAATNSAKRLLSLAKSATANSSGVVSKVIRPRQIAYVSYVAYAIRRKAQTIKAASGASLAGVSRAGIRKATAIAGGLAMISKNNRVIHVLTALGASVARRATSYIKPVFASCYGVLKRSVKIQPTVSIGAFGGAGISKKASKGIPAAIGNLTATRFGHTNKLAAANAASAAIMRTPQLSRIKASSTNAAQIKNVTVRSVLMLIASAAVNAISAIFTSGGLPVANAMHTITLKRRVRKIIMTLRNRA